MDFHYSTGAVCQSKPYDIITTKMRLHYAEYFSILAKDLETVVITGGYPALFLVVFLEGLPLVGTVVPGHVAIIAAGFLAKIGILNLWLVFAISLTAALAGDYMGYMLGRKYGLGLIDRLRPYFFLSDNQLNRAQGLLAKHTGKAMILGRLSPVTRALMPFLVGAGQVKVGKFWLYNLIGGFIWVVCSVLLGYAFGAGYAAVSGYFGKAVIVGIIFTAVILWGYRFVNIRFHIFKRYELFVLALNILSLWGLAEMIEDVWSRAPFLANLDLAVNGFMANLTGHIAPVTASIAEWVSAIGSPSVLIAAGIILSAWFLSRGRFRSGAVIFISMIAANISVGLMKGSEFFAVDRPLNAIQILADHSFPSGHAAVAAAFFTALAYILSPKIKSWVIRESYIACSAIVILAVGLSRLVLNVHWFSDVVAGWSLGVFSATASILLIKYVGILLVGRAITEKAPD